jgi:hypothetical protein
VDVAVCAIVVELQGCYSTPAGNFCTFSTMLDEAIANGDPSALLQPVYFYQS